MPPIRSPLRPGAAARGLPAHGSAYVSVDKPAHWLILALAALVFIVQLLGAAHHDHELAAKSQHCVSCVLHAQPHAAPPDAVLRVVPLAWILEYAVIGTLITAAPPAVSDYLLPLPHAPPPFPHHS